MSRKSHTEGASVAWVQRDPRGRIVSRGKLPFHSFLTQYYNMLYVLMGGSSGVANTNSVTDTAGAVKVLGNNLTGENILGTQDPAGAGTIGIGIQVGTGSAANSASTYGLTTPIANGVSSGQLVLGSMSIVPPSGSSPLTMTFARTFTNSSGGTIGITEIMLAAWWGFVFALTRDTFAALNVTNGNSITFTITLSYAIA